MRFFQYIKTPRSLRLSRQIWNFNPPKPEILIGNNTVLFAALSCITHHGMKSHPNLKIICPPFWLDNIHECFLKEKWGQTKNGLPKVVRDIFSEIYPRHPDNEYITWGQMQELRKTALYLLKNTYKVPIFYGVPSIRKLENNSFDITVGDDRFNAPDDTHFYLWYKVPKKHNIPGLSERSTTEMYQINPSELPTNLDIIALGGGLSIYWLAKHFATVSNTRRIICLIREADKLRMNVPSNASVDLKRIVVVDLERSVISVAKDDSRLAIVKNGVKGDEYVGVFCSAIGLAPPYDFVKDVPPPQLTSPKNWFASKWISQKNNPPGALIESYLELLEVTNNLDWGFEPQSYHEAHNPFRILINNCISSGIKIDTNYLIALENALKAGDNSLPDSLVMPLFLKQYKEMYEPTPEDMRLFQKEVALFLKKRLDLVSNIERESTENTFSV